MSATPTRKKFMFVNRRPPHGTIFAMESLEVALVASAFGQRITMAFIDDGVYQLCRGQNPSRIGLKDFSKTFGALGDYDIRDIYVERESLVKRGLASEDLLRLVYEDDDGTEKETIRALSSYELAEVFAEQDVIFNF